MYINYAAKCELHKLCVNQLILIPGSDNYDYSTIIN